LKKKINHLDSPTNQQNPNETEGEMEMSNKEKANKNHY
jgi:hypothetical protein